MGTHNALMKLGAGRYWRSSPSIPRDGSPNRPRWFELDDAALRARIAERPRLVHWVARTDDLDSCLAACPPPLGTVHPTARGAYRWRITISDDGRRPAGGVLPALIQWDVPAHPADGLPDSPVSLVRLEATHPDPGAVRAALAALRLRDAMEVRGGPEPGPWPRSGRRAAWSRSPHRLEPVRRPRRARNRPTPATSAQGAGP